MQEVGIVGVGRMGRAMARHLIARGFAVTAADVDAGAREAARAIGATVADSPAALAVACETVFVAVGYDEEVAAVCRGDDGVFAAARQGTVVVVNSTASVDLVRQLADEAAARRLGFLDVPIARGAAAAEAGTLLALAGGDADLLALVRPMLEAFCSDIAHLGAVGHGQVAKAINNLLLWVDGVALTEAGRLAAGTGIDLPRLREALLKSSGRSWALENWDAISFTWASKDMQLVVEMCDRAGLTLPLVGLVQEQVEPARDAKQRDEVRWTRR